MTRDPAEALDELERLKTTFGSGAASRKLELLEELEAGRLAHAWQVFALHEALLFLRAYPDSSEVSSRVTRMLDEFDRRRDLRRLRRDLENSGIAGTSVYFSFFWFTALWIARRWPQQLEIDWPEFERRDLLDQRIPFLMPFAERLALDEVTLGPRKCLELLKGPDETSAAFLVRRFAALKGDSLARERIFEELDVPFHLKPGPSTPSRTRAHYARSPAVFHKRPLRSSRRSFRPALDQRPRASRSLEPGEARPLIDLARAAMVSRLRDLDVFIHADPHDLRLFDAGRGLQFVSFGVRPERRQILDAVYGFLFLKNGVPIGYFLTSALFSSAEVAYNLFETYRGGEAAYIYGRGLAMVRRLFRARSFVVDPYQLGHGNREGLESGAWWFYYKLGFRPTDPEVLDLVGRELARMKKNPRYRSSIATLEELSSVEMYLHLEGKRKQVLGVFSREAVGYRVSEYLAARFGAERERGIRTCSREAAELLGLPSLDELSRPERQAWERWAPLALVLPGVERWPARDRRRLARVIRAKGGRRESDFVRLFDRHTKLRRAVFALGRETGD